MQPISDDGVVTALSSVRSDNAWLIFFVDGGDEAGRDIAGLLESCSDSYPDKKIVLIRTHYHSELHLQFEVVYGSTPVNTVTFISTRGAAFIRWNGHGNLKEVIEEVLSVEFDTNSELYEFGYPTEEFVRELMLSHSDNGEVLQANETESAPAIKDEEMQMSVDKEMPATEEKEMHPSRSSAKKYTSGQSKDVTVLQIRCPDGSSVTKTFPTSTLLSEVREVIAAHFSSEGFGLATSFPRHHYVSEDYSRNLGELDLWPNAVLLIVPADPRQENNETSLWSYTANLNNWAYTLIMYMWNSISSFFPFTSGGSSQPETRTSDRQENVQPGPSGSRRRTNIHTLRDTDKDDDKRRTTYNGNSTQQL